jgi:D-xylose transport system substrate-binding protein
MSPQDVNKSATESGAPDRKGNEGEDANRNPKHRRYRAMKANRTILAVAATVATLALGACGSDDDEGGDSGDSASGGGGLIGFLLPESQTARYESQDKPLFEAKVEELCPDCEIFYQNADQDAAKQQQQVEAAVTEGVDVLVLDPVDSTSAAALATRAKDAGIPVISYDRLILDADLDYYAEFNSSEVGNQQGTALAEKLAEDGNPSGPIIQINGDPKDNNAKLFKEGAAAVFADEGIEVAQEYDTPDWLPENAQKQMDQAITAVGQDGFKGVLAANDGTAGGAIAALKAAGIDPSTIPVTGQDAELAGIQRIVSGEQYMTVYKPIKPLADDAATLAVALANGEEPPADIINGEEDNGTEQVPSAITDTIPVFEDNIEDTIIADDYWTVEEICTADYAQACKELGLQ